MQAPLVLKGTALVASLMLQDHAQHMPEAMVAAVLTLHDHALLVPPLPCSITPPGCVLPSL